MNRRWIRTGLFHRATLYPRSNPHLSHLPSLSSLISLISHLSSLSSLPTTRQNTPDPGKFPRLCNAQRSHKPCRSFSWISYSQWYWRHKGPLVTWQRLVDWPQVCNRRSPFGYPKTLSLLPDLGAHPDRVFGFRTWTWREADPGQKKKKQWRLAIKLGRIPCGRCCRRMRPNPAALSNRLRRPLWTTSTTITTPIPPIPLPPHSPTNTETQV